MRLSPLLTPHAVVQRHQSIPVWGWTDRPRTRIKAGLGPNRAEGISGDDGRFLLRLPELPAGGPHLLTVESQGGGERIEVQDILIGEVWLASGQSNMVWPMGASGYTAEIATAKPDQIRMFTVANRADHGPQSTVKGEWQVATPQTFSNFSAVANFFAQRLQNELGVPCGIINASWSGTFIEPWISRERLLQNQNQRVRDWVRDYEVEHNFGLIAMSDLMGHDHPGSPYILFENMIKPLLPVGIAGAIWYQGESNAVRPDEYRTLLRDLIADWRQHFAVGDFPFGIVQLTSFKSPQSFQPNSDWARLRESQQDALDVPGTGLAVILDAGDAFDIHPKDKKTVGHRLAQWALAKVYGRALIPGGPLYRTHRIEDSRMRIFFDQAGDGLALRDGDMVRTLVIAGPDGVFQPAKSAIEDRSLLVWHPDITAPKAVRYAWADNPEGANLINKDGFPAGPFRTDR